MQDFNKNKAWLSLIVALAAGISFFPPAFAADQLAAAPTPWPRGKALFEKKCSLCHAVGQGNEKTAASLHIAPAQLDLSLSRAKTKQIEAIILKGHHKMPGLSGLSDAELKELIGYVQSLRPTTTARSDLPAPAPLPR